MYQATDMLMCVVLSFTSIDVLLTEVMCRHVAVIYMEHAECTYVRTYTDSITTS